MIFIMLAFAAVGTGEALPGSDLFLSKYNACAHTMATVYDIDNCSSFDQAMQKATDAVEADIHRLAVERDRAQADAIKADGTPGLVAQLADEQKAFDLYAEVACSHFNDRGVWGTDGQRILLPICGMQFASDRLRVLRTLLDYLQSR